MLKTELIVEILWICGVPFAIFHPLATIYADANHLKFNHFHPYEES